MPTTAQILEFDEDGFLKDPLRWDSKTALELARLHGLDSLNIQQWAIIFTLRQYYFSHQEYPSQHRICHIKNLHSHCVDSLFENHGIEAWRIAGLPNPGEEIKAYL
jgi:TusE/DsrC/DsvC family sulfur relay protein